MQGQGLSGSAFFLSFPDPDHICLFPTKAIIADPGRILNKIKMFDGSWNLGLMYFS